MPSLKASTIGAGGWTRDRAQLEAWKQRDLDRLATDPRCDVCHWPMSPHLHSLGSTSHPCCDPSRFQVGRLERDLGRQLMAERGAA